MDPQLRGSILDGQRSQTCAKSVILQRDRGTEQCHRLVAVVLDRPAVTAHHRCRVLQVLGHDLAPPLDVHRRGDAHRSHHIGKQHVTCLYSAAPRRTAAGARRPSRNVAFSRSAFMTDDSPPRSSHSPRRCVLRSQAISPFRNSDSSTPGRSRRHHVPRPARRATAAA